jgi:predicted DNA-binding transcriptional regulator AlpA
MGRLPYPASPEPDPPRASADRLWSAQEVAAFLGVPVGTLYQWRWRGEGPKAYRVGRWLRYDGAEVRRWLDAQVV